MNVSIFNIFLKVLFLRFCFKNYSVFADTYRAWPNLKFCSEVAHMHINGPCEREGYQSITCKIAYKFFYNISFFYQNLEYDLPLSIFSKFCIKYCVTFIIFGYIVLHNCEWIHRIGWQILRRCILFLQKSLRTSQSCFELFNLMCQMRVIIFQTAASPRQFHHMALATYSIFWIDSWRSFLQKIWRNLNRQKF